MRGRGRIAAAVAASVAASLVFTGAGQASDPDLGWPQDLGGPDDIGFVIEDSWIYVSSIHVPMPGWQPSCTTMDDPACAVPAKEYGWWITRVAPPCTLAVAWEECVEGLSLTTPGSGTRALTWTRLAPGATFPADEARGMPTGSTMSLYDDPDSPDPNVGYAVSLGGQMVGRTGPFRLGEFGAQVIRYREVPNGQQPGSGRCLWYGPNSSTCAYRIAFADSSSLGLSLRLSDAVTGWLGGRLQDPSIEVTPLRGGMNRLVVKAQPVDVPLIAIHVPVSAATSEILDYWRATFTCEGPKPCEKGVMSVRSSGPLNADLMHVFTGLLGDTATASIPTWSVSNLQTRSADRCLSDRTRLLGLVTTNATSYSPDPPSFVDNSLHYRVSALHFLPGRETLSGTYDLILRSDVARCLYGFSDAPIKAEIQVTSDDGTEQVATTSVSERDGWLHLAAYDFHFSQPTISVKLSGTRATTTIICRKGKKTKKVSGAPPTCPAGWRPLKRP